MTNETNYKLLSKEISELAENMPPGEQHGTETWNKWKKTAQNLGNKISTYCDELKEGEERKRVRLNKKYVETLLEAYRKIEVAGYKKSVEGFDEKKNQLINTLKELEEIEEETGESFLDRGEWDDQVYDFIGFFIEKQLDKIHDGLMDEWNKIQKEHTDPKDSEYTIIPPGTMAAVYWDVKIGGVPLCLHFRYWGKDYEEDIIYPDTKTAKEYMRAEAKKGDPKIDVYVYEGTTEEHGTWRAYYADLDSFINHFWRYNLLNEDGESANIENDEGVKNQVEYIKTWTDGGLPFEEPDGTGVLYTPPYSDTKDPATGETILGKDRLGSNEVCVYTPEELKKYMQYLRKAVESENNVLKLYKRLSYFALKAYYLDKGKISKEDEAEDDKVADLLQALEHETMPPFTHNSVATYHDPLSYLLFHRLGHFTSWPSPDRVIPPWLTEEEYDNRISNPLKLEGNYENSKLKKWREENRGRIHSYVEQKTGKKLPNNSHDADWVKITDTQKQAIKEILAMKQETWEKQGGPQMVEEEYSKRKQEIEKFKKAFREWKENLTPKEKQAMEKEVEEMLGGGT